MGSGYKNADEARYPNTGMKIFNAIIETFDDATDFLDSGHLQHFNINTPSGYKNISAAKHTPETTSTVATALTLPTVAKGGATAKAAKRQGSVAAASPAKRIWRVKPMGKLKLKLYVRTAAAANSIASNSIDTNSIASNSIDSNSIDSDDDILSM
ncbi:uncharacterized protein LOC133848809 [Drosophila sulfurigaster albostrigata]|uniref:uncharacterized protein LOC133848809 n=1 Tax=Drosophila sulfurigaster albostrigata TaxID=89887 RepID=UPI002D21A971|nr:uncharacterized protein LOC133848809 [Drosophila sulfurigaster albostrigata]